MFFLLSGLTSVENAVYSQSVEADKIFLGGDFITVADNKTEVEALAVFQGKILAVGTEQEIFKFKAAHTEIIDLQGQTLLPGLIDAHTHPILSSLMGQTVDVSGFTNKSIAEVMTSLETGINNASKGEWILAFGWDPAIHRDLKAPTIEQLNQLAPDNPLLILTQTMHTAFVNSKAFAAAGINNNTPDPKGGYFERDKNGEFTGTIIEVNAISKFRQVLPKFPASVYHFLLTEQLNNYAKAGYTTIVAPGVQPVIRDHLTVFKQAAEHQQSPLRAHLYPLPEYVDAKSEMTQDSAKFKIMGIKLYIDGSPYAGGMAMNTPYLNSTFNQQSLNIPVNSKGHLNYSDTDLNAIVARYHQHGWQISAHVQGERAVAQFLTAVELAQKDFPRRDYRHRMEHNALITPELLARATALGVTSSFYIEHVSYYADALLEDIVGAEKANRFMPMNSAKQQGHRFSIHTDTPSSPLDVLHAMQTAVLRKSQSGNYVLGEDEKITVDDAIKAVTINAAWQIFEEDSRGSLEVGKLADFTVMSKNIRNIAPEHWTDIQITGTYLSGVAVEHGKWDFHKISLITELVYDMAKTKLLQPKYVWFVILLLLLLVLFIRKKNVSSQQRK